MEAEQQPELQPHDVQPGDSLTSGPAKVSREGLSPKRFWNKPAATAVMKAARGLATVITGSRRAQEMRMESTPDSGVEIRNEDTAALSAPCFLREAATGSTLQEQRGKGMPARAAFITEESPRLPRCLAMYSGERNILITPARTRPNTKNGAAWRKRSQEKDKTSWIKWIMPVYKPI